MKEQASPPGTGSVRDLAASSTYFETEAHYKSVAATIRAAGDRADGYVLVTGDPAPSGLPLARALSAEGTPRCDVGVIACHPELSFAALVTSYAARWGIAVAEAEARQHWRRIAALMRPRRGPIYALVLEHAERLDDAVLDELAASGDRRAPVVLLASEALVRRLETPPLARLKSTIATQLRFRELARNEIEAFIRFQLSNTGGAGRDVFTARVVELLAAQSTTDPAAVEKLTGAIADAARGMGSGVLAGLRMRALKQNVTGTAVDLGLELATASTTRVPPASAGAEPPQIAPHDPPPLRRLQSVLADDRRAGGARAGGPAATAWPAPHRRPARALADEARGQDAQPIRRAAMAGVLILGIAALSAGVTLYPDSPREVWDWGHATWVGRSSESAAPMQAQADNSTPPVVAPARPSGEPAPAVAATALPSSPPEMTSAAPAPPTAATSRDAAAIEPATAEPLPGATGSSNEPIAPKTEPSPAAPQQMAAAPPPEPRAAAAAGVPTADLVTLLWRGDRLLAAGEIVAARHFFERAAATGDPGAACGAGKSYDPLFLKQLGVRGVVADPAKAIAWYRKAAAAGSAEAPALLERLLAALPS